MPLPKLNPCEYTEECLNYDENSFTCNVDGGGSYCGTYRRKEVATHA